MGVVYLGEHSVIGRQAAIKLLLPAMSANAEAVQRFFNEARATARIKHPGIVEILDCGLLANQQAYIVMEFLQGETLGAYCERNGKLAGDVGLARAILRQVAQALGAAHDRGIIHRDLKPENVFLAGEGAGTSASIKILDFGIAKLVSAGKVPVITHTKELLGTPVYISPEQAAGGKALDHRADIYSLGCIAFEMLTGRPVFTADSIGELIGAHMFREPPSVLELEPAVPRALAELVRRMLAKAPEARPGTMDEIVAAIDAEGPVPMSGNLVSLPAPRPVHLALPVDDPKDRPGIPTVLAGGATPPPRSPESTLDGLASEAGRAAPGGKRRALWLAGAGGAAVAAVIAVLAGRSSAPAPAPAPIPAAAPVAAPPAPATVEVDVEDAPPGLAVTVDGRPARLPVSLPRGADVHHLTFAAPGFEALARELDGTKSRTLVLDMKRAAPPPEAPPPEPAAAKPAAKPAPKGAKPAGGKRRSTDLFLDL
jgi:serine/threonine-protein kinase